MKLSRNLPLSVKATKLRIAKEVCGITQLESELEHFQRLAQANARLGEREEAVEVHVEKLKDLIEVKLSELKTTNPELFH